jgi:HPt (histidine-containing phosphotransfer) domain-containing protein
MKEIRKLTNYEGIACEIHEKAIFENEDGEGHWLDVIKGAAVLKRHFEPLQASHDALLELQAKHDDLISRIESCGNNPDPGSFMNIAHKLLEIANSARKEAPTVAESNLKELQASHGELLQNLQSLVDAIEDAGGHDENGDVFDIEDACKAIKRAESLKQEG